MHGCLFTLVKSQGGRERRMERKRVRKGSK